MTVFTSPVAQLGLNALHIADGVLADPVTYTAAARAQLFTTVAVGGSSFHGIAPCGDPELATWITDRFPYARPGVSFLRVSPMGQSEPHFVHTDQDMGDWTGILYLTEEPVIGDGTIFWRDRVTGHNISLAQTPEELDADWTLWQQTDRWEEWARVHARPNRLVLFPSALYHSRALIDNYGTGPDARLIQVIFGTGSLARTSWR